MKWKLIIFFCLILSQSFAQVQLKGKVVDKKGQPIFAVNIYKKTQSELGTSTNFDGNFNLQLKESTGILVFSFIGYQTKEVKLSSDLTNKSMTIVLKEDSQTLREVIIKAKDPISQKFSVTKIKKLDIYFNPVAQADGLKAITLMPASTTIDETANPSLRGTSPDRTRVILNGVPVYTPVRSSQLNNQGFFSLFSTEVIDKEYVYASNPPLTYGNSSAGLVEIQTLKRLPENQ
ncbi:carboxypeptidase-like regulatory domain-containing protein [Balneicella halophila]|uniref:carboxypeptidase-like regulatory domain-containing protein n=1 Tax=Balneicella halophila TaxID=1537566 RepID=UPI000E309C5E|nr:Plug domain-containing protein [Balneicella halophila]